jgi:hypothetical protein
VEYDPLIPAETRLILTTNPQTVAKSSSTLRLGMNISANDRYFDRPEVVKAYRTQEMIQTPEFINIENSAAMGRLRPRNSEDVRVPSTPFAFPPSNYLFFGFRGQLIPPMQHTKKGIASTKHSRSVYDYERRKNSSMSSTN